MAGPEGDKPFQKLGGQLALYTITTVFARGATVLSLLFLPIFLTPGQYGVLGLIATGSALLVIIVPIEVSQGLARYYGTADAATQRAYLSTATNFTLAMTVAWTIALAAIARPLAKVLLGDASDARLILFALPFMVGTIIQMFLQSMLRWQFRTRAYAILSLAYAFLTLGLAVLFAARMPDPLIGAVVGQSLGAVIAMTIGLFFLRGHVTPVIDRRRLADMLGFSAPIAVAGIALFVTTYSSRLVLNDLLDLPSVGIFTLASQISTIPSLMILGIQAFLSPLVMTHFENSATPPAVARLFEGFVGVAVLACLVFGLFAPTVVALIGARRYAAVGPLVMILAPAYLMLQMYVFAPGFLIAKRTGRQLVVALTGGIAAIVGNYLLIPLSGLMGAAVAVLMSAALFLTTWFALSQPLYRIPIRWSRVCVIVATFAIAAIVGTVVAPNAIIAKASLACALAGVVAWTGVVPRRVVGDGLTAVRRFALPSRTGA